MRKLVYFVLSDGRRFVGAYDSETDEITLPSGYKLPVEDGFVFFLGEWCEVFDLT
jgi:hypothetical protein